MGKELDSSEYKISSKDFERLERKYGLFSVDMFASDWSHQMKPLYSKYLCHGTAGIDVFAQDWSIGDLFCHPPVN